jgi:hypothetical protein
MEPGPSPLSEPQEVTIDDSITMAAIGALRYRVWEEEGSINAAAFGDRKSWLDSLDYVRVVCPGVANPARPAHHPQHESVLCELRCVCWTFGVAALPTHTNAHTHTHTHTQPHNHTPTQPHNHTNTHTHHTHAHTLCHGQEVGVARHFVVRDAGGEVVAAARMSLHPVLDPSNRDLALWERCGKAIPLPTVDLGRWVGPVLVRQCLPSPPKLAPGDRIRRSLDPRHAPTLLCSDG